MSECSDYIRDCRLHTRRWNVADENECIRCGRQLSPTRKVRDGYCQKCRNTMRLRQRKLVDPAFVAHLRQLDRAYRARKRIRQHKDRKEIKE